MSVPSLEHMPLLRCEELHKAFGGLKALDGVTLEFPDQGIFAIIGPNGAGKTTLINILTGFLKPDRGCCVLLRTCLSGRSPHRVAQLGISRTFQDLRLIRRLTVLNNVLLAFSGQKGERLLWGIFPFGVSEVERRNRRQAEEILSFVGLLGKAHDLAGSLSYGQQKLLTLACCLATDPKILILDEPVAGVHPSQIDDILNRLLRIRQQQRLIIFIEHDLDAVKKVADSVIVMDHGQVIAIGKPKEVLSRPEILGAYVE